MYLFNQGKKGSGAAATRPALAARFSPNQKPIQHHLPAIHSGPLDQERCRGVKLKLWEFPWRIINFGNDHSLLAVKDV